LAHGLRLSGYKDREVEPSQELIHSLPFSSRTHS